MTPRRRRLLVAGAGLALLLVAWFGVPAVLRRLDFFRVRRVEVIGARYLSGAEVAQALGLPAGASVFDDTDPWQARVAALEGVESAEVGRRLPGTLRVRLREAEAVALAAHEGRLALVDARGRLLPFDPTRAPPDLPVLDDPVRLAGVVARIRSVDPALFAELVRASRVRDHVVLEAGSRRLLMRLDASVEEIQNMAAVAGVLVARQQAWRELDGRFAGLVVVRGLGG